MVSEPRHLNVDFLLGEVKTKKKANKVTRPTVMETSTQSLLGTVETPACSYVFLFLVPGGIGGLVLALFHKLETGKRTQKIQDRIPFLRRTEEVALCAIVVLCELHTGLDV